MANPSGYVRTVVANQCRSAVRRRLAEARALGRLGRGRPPVAVGAAATAALAFAEGPLALQWVVFVAVAALTLVGLRPLGRRLARGNAHLVEGANRWVGKEGTVVDEIPDGGRGWVAVGREHWRATSGLDGPILPGAAVLVTAVEGAHLVVLPLDPPFPATPDPGHPGPPSPTQQGADTWPT